MLPSGMDCSSMCEGCYKPSWGVNCGPKPNMVNSQRVMRKLCWMCWSMCLMCQIQTILKGKPVYDSAIYCEIFMCLKYGQYNQKFNDILDNFPMM